MKENKDELKKLAQERINEIQSKGDEYLKKVNLVHHGEGNEGIWVSLISDEDLKKYSNDSSKGETCEGYLVNMPLGWGNACWGSKIKFKTNGEDRPYATLDMQDDDFKERNSELYHGLVLLQENEEKQQ